MRNLAFVGSLSLALCASLSPRLAQACGGFFCGREPVDQTAERILFAVGEGSTTMAVQIQYSGAAADFAWVLPLAEVPDEQSFEVFPQRALTALDANTGPVFQLPTGAGCFSGRGTNFFGVPASADGNSSVTVHFEVEVGPFDAVVVESGDPQELVTWLRDNGYRVAPPMEPYISIYTGEGMKFLALKLRPGEDVEDIQPLKFTLPGETPSIPIRLTALAAEPEMSLLVFVLGDQRFEGANWDDVTIDDGDIEWQIDWTGFSGVRTNWPALVAKGIDAVGGRGWVTELAGPSQQYADLIRNQGFVQPEDEEAAMALLDLLDAHPYLTRLYARLSAEEMTLDPVFRRSSGGDVDNLRQLSQVVNGKDQCEVGDGGLPPPVDPCRFTTCGAGGECFLVDAPDGGAGSVAACACVPGATARTTFDPSGAATVVCQDRRLSFLNPGDRGTDGSVLPDPCAGFDCGLGRCEAVNLTPTCICNEGAVAVGTIDGDGTRRTTCQEPAEPVPAAFYARRLPDLPAALPGGRVIDVPVAEDPPSQSESDSGGWCTMSGAAASRSAGSTFYGVAAFAAALAVARRRHRRANP